MSIARVQAALDAIPEKAHPSNAQIIAECIRQELKALLISCDTVSEAERCIGTMLTEEFASLQIVQPFSIRRDDGKLFSKWSVTVTYPVGEPMLITQDS
jgi:hypothetical protein